MIIAVRNSNSNNNNNNNKNNNGDNDNKIMRNNIYVGCWSSEILCIYNSIKTVKASIHYIS